MNGPYILTPQLVNPKTCEWLSVNNEWPLHPDTATCKSKNLGLAADRILTLTNWNMFILQIGSRVGSVELISVEVIKLTFIESSPTPCSPLALDSSCSSRCGAGHPARQPQTRANRHLAPGLLSPLRCLFT